MLANKTNISYISTSSSRNDKLLKMNKLFNLFVGYLVTLFVGCILLVLVALTGSESLTYGLVGILVLITFAFLFSTNIFAQE